METEQYAAIVVEIPPMRHEDIAEGIVSDMAIDCKRYGMKLILDEIVTGFRYNRMGAIETYMLNPDFLCLGKALSTYGKVSALVGPLDIMNALTDKVFASYTFNDHPLGLLDACLTLDAHDACADLYPHIERIGTTLKDGLNKIFIRRGFEAEVYGHPSRTTIESKMKPEIYSEFLDRMVDEHNVLLHRPQFATRAHSHEHVDRTLDAAEKTLESMGFTNQ